MRSITILICLILLMSNISHPVYAEDSVIKQELLELESLIDKESFFSFNHGMYGKLLVKEELKKAILLAENNNLKELRFIIHHLLIEIRGPSIRPDSESREDIRRRLTELLMKITQD